MFCSVICKFITEGRQEGRNLFYIFLNLSCMQALMFPLLSLSVLCLFSCVFLLFFFFPPDIYLFASMKLFASATKSASDSSKELNFQYPGPLFKLFM